MVGPAHPGDNLLLRGLLAELASRRLPITLILDRYTDAGGLSVAARLILDLDKWSIQERNPLVVR